MDPLLLTLTRWFEKKYRRQKGISAAVLLAFCFLAAVGGNAYAANPNSICMPQPYPVPGLPGPPNWLTATNSDGSTNVWDGNHSNDWMNDPRWTGALAIGYVNGSAYDVNFRAVSAGSPPTLYLSWNVRVDPTSTSADIPGSVLSVGLFPEDQVGLGPTATGYVIQVTRHTRSTCTGMTAASCPNDSSSLGTPANPVPYAPPAPQSPVPNRNFDVSLFQESTANTWTDVTSATPWFSGLIQSMRISKFPDAANTWNVAMEIPIGNGGASGPNLLPGGNTKFLFWHDVQPMTVAGAVDDYHWPRVGNYFYDPNALANSAFPDPFTNATQWGEIQLQQLNPSCPAQNVVDLNDISQVGTNPSGAANSVLSQTINAKGINIFAARPTNKWGQTIPKGNLNVTFRIADWGSTYDPVAPWTVIPNLQSVQTQQDISANAPIDLEPPMASTTLDLSDLKLANETYPAGQECKLRCDLLGSAGTPTSPAGQCMCPSGTSARTTDQCILVTLAGNVDFASNSIRRNMEIATASDFQRDAQIDVAGLPPTGSPTRDVYIFVEKQNMPGFPAMINGTPEPPKPRPVPPPPPPPPTPVPNLESRTVAPPAEGGPTTSVNPTVQLASVLPTEILHVFDDTGRTEKVKGVVYPILVPQGSFGYFMQHQGLFFGWQTALLGATPGLLITEIAPNFYKLSGVPNGGKVMITTKISTIDFTTWWIWLIALVILLIILLLVWLVRRLVHA